MWQKLLSVLVAALVFSTNIPNISTGQAETSEQHKTEQDLIEHTPQLKEKTIIDGVNADLRLKRRVDGKFRGKPKPRNEILSTKFHVNLNRLGQTNSLVTLINKIAKEYLTKCPPVIYYDSYVEKSDGLILESLFKTFPLTYYHGEVDEHYEAKNPHLKLHIDNNCKSYILFLSDPLMTRKIIGPQIESRVVLVSRSTQWKLRDFLSSEESSNIVNLLVIGESLTSDPMKERPYVLYTHKLYADGLGSNTPVVLTSWLRGALSRPHINLFPPKFQNGFAGHRFQVSAANQPPFIFRLSTLDNNGNQNIYWDGIEHRLITTIGKRLNFSVDIIETPTPPASMGIVHNIQAQVKRRAVDMGMNGIYITDEHLTETDMSVGHSKDCAAFITLASKALPKYRAIMGPFQWPVWVALVFVYLGAIFPIVYTDRLTLSHLIGNWSEIENMFWYVFGMFTNSLTFSGKYSWSNTQKNSTRLLIGSYWIFTIIITACYTGSIIAFVTLPAFPDTIDSVNDLLGLFFRVATLDNGGWESWFLNSTHMPTAKLFKKMEFVSNIEEGIGNVTQSFFWNYAFLGSRSQLEYLVQSNFSDENISRRSALHLSDECFALFQIGFIYPRNAVYKHKIDSMILLAQQSGIVQKIEHEVRWTMQRTSNGKLLQANSVTPLREFIQDERQLTTADTEGMFLLMGIGYLIAATALISEIVGGITNKCRQILKRSRRMSTARWSSKSTLSDEEANQSSSAAQKAHNKHKAKQRRHMEATQEANHKKGFGVRELNLTRTTLKELYGNYYKTEPNYVLKNGKLLLETDAVSTDSTDCGSSVSNVEEASFLHRKPKSLVLAEVNVDTNMSENEIKKAIASIDEVVNELENVVKEEQAAEPIDVTLFGSVVKVESDTSKLVQLQLSIDNDDTTADAAPSTDFAGEDGLN